MFASLNASKAASTIREMIKNQKDAVVNNLKMIGDK